MFPLFQIFHHTTDHTQLSHWYSSLACLLVSLLIADGRRSRCVPTVFIVAYPSPTVNTPPFFSLTSPGYHQSISSSAFLVFHNLYASNER